MNPLYNLIIAPIYFAIIYFGIAPFFAKRWTNRHNRKYFYQALAVKLLGALAFCGIYQFYYGGGDTTMYFEQGSRWVEIFFNSPTGAYKVLQYDGTELDGKTAQYLQGLYSIRKNPSTGMVSKISGIIQLFTFQSFYATALFFGFWAFLGTWKLYQVFEELYPRARKILPYAILFVPSCLFWSSGIMKETITTGGVGFITYYFYAIVFKKKFNPLYFIFLFFCFKIVGVVKGATVYTLLPCLGLWVLLKNYQRIPTFLRVFTTLLLILSLPVALVLLGNTIAREIEQNEAFNDAQSTVEGFQWDHGRRSQGHGGGEASTYTLSTTGDFSVGGLLLAFPEAISYTLFRPFPWEASKAVQLIGAMESFTFLIITIWVILRIGVFKFVARLQAEPALIMALAYSCLFGFIAGYISFNYGVLQRFKTPMMPFYAAILAVLFNQITVSKKNSKVSSKPTRKNRQVRPIQKL